MNSPSAPLRPGLRVSSRVVNIAIALMAVAALLLSGGMGDPLAVQFQIAGLALGVVAGVIWLLDRRWPVAGRWAIVVSLAGLVCSLVVVGAPPGTATLLAVPTALAAAMIGLPAGLGTAVLLTAVLALLGASPDYSTTYLDAAVSLACIWSVLGVIVLVQDPVRQVGGWLDEYYERSRASIDEARDRKAELEQTLESLAHANRQLALASERNSALRTIAEDAQATKAAFVANVSHEFRTPLNMIIGLVDLMAESPEIYAVSLSPKMRDDLGVVHRNCEHLSKMIDDVLDLSRSEAGQLSLHRERVDLREVVDNSVAVVRPLLEKKRLAMHVEVPEDLPDIYCDRTRIQQVILNLLSNAARFTEEGGIAIGAVRQDQQILVTVADTGPGIPADDADRVFEPFVQATGSRWQGKDGSGLGLSISKEFVRLHGGRMWLESEVGSGTTFHFSLPVSAPVEPTAGPAHRIREDWIWREPAFRAAQAAADERLRRPRLLVCDETGTLQGALAQYGEAVEIVGTTSVADAALELGRCPAHAVLVNAAGGDDLRTAMGEVTQVAPRMPVIGCSVPRPEERALSAGAQGHLVKPVTRDDLSEALDAVGRPVRKVLIVDDDPDVLDLFRRMLHVCDQEMEVLTAESGRSGLRLLRDAHPDLVLLDIMMPEMDGWQLLDEIAKGEDGQRTSVFFVSAQEPAEQPLNSRFMLVTIGDGIPLASLLRYSLHTSVQLPMPGAELGPAPA